MQSEFTASAVAWGFSTFSKNKCVVKALHSTLSSSPSSCDIVSDTVEEVSDSDNLLHTCSPNESLIISQGSPFEIGLEFSPLPSSTDTGTLEEFVESFEKHKELLKIDIQMKLLGGGRNFLPRETADVQKCERGAKHCHSLDSIIFRPRAGGFYIGNPTPDLVFALYQKVFI